MHSHENLYDKEDHNGNPPSDHAEVPAGRRTSAGASEELFEVSAAQPQGVAMGPRAPC